DGGDEPAEGGRAGTDVHRHVPHLAFDHPDQLPLRPPELQVQAAPRVLHRGGMVVLHEGGGQAGRGVAHGVERLEEEAAGVVVHHGLDHEHAGNVGGGDVHRRVKADTNLAAVV